MGKRSVSRFPVKLMGLDQKPAKPCDRNQERRLPPELGVSEQTKPNRTRPLLASRSFASPRVRRRRKPNLNLRALGREVHLTTELPYPLLESAFDISSPPRPNETNFKLRALGEIVDSGRLFRSEEAHLRLRRHGFFASQPTRPNVVDPPKAGTQFQSAGSRRDRWSRPTFPVSANTLDTFALRLYCFSASQNKRTQFE